MKIGTNRLTRWATSLACWLGAGGLAMSATNVYYVVPDNPSAQSPFDTWGKAATNIQAAVDQASADYAAGGTQSVVVVSNGVYTVTAQIAITNAITLLGFSGNAGDTAIRGAYPASTNRCLFLTGGATADGFTITNGAADAAQAGGNNGGGAYLSGGTLRNCVIAGNRLLGASGKGAGLLVAGASSLVTNCVIVSNRGITSAYGGGAYMTGGLMTDCAILNNDGTDNSPSVGGVYGVNCRILRCFFSGNSGRIGAVNLDSGGVIADSVVSNNVSTLGSYAGMLLDGNGLATNCLIVAQKGSKQGTALAFNSGGLAHSCTIRGNTALYGVVNMNNGSLINCLVMGNSVTTNGAVYMMDNGTIENCTIVRNQSGGTVGGLYSTVPGLTVRNTVISDNEAPSGNWFIAGTAGNVLEFNCTDPLMGGLSNIVASPLFINSGTGYGTNAAGGDFRLTQGSPCVNAGKNQAWMSRGLDLDGNPRLRPLSTGRVDIGCYEAAALSVPLACEMTASPSAGLAPVSVVLAPLVDGNTNGLGCQWVVGAITSEWMGLVKVTNSFPAGFHTVVLSVTNAAGETASRTNVNFIKSSPAVLYAATNGLHQSPYESWPTAATNIQAAVDLAGADVSTVLVGDGVYTVQAPIAISNAVTVRSFSGNPANAVIRGAYPASTNRCLTISGAGAVVEGFTITNGNAYTAYGGGVYMTAASTVRNCIMIGNITVSTSAGIGGGIAATAGSVLNCEIRNNSSTASGGGGGVFANGAGVVVRNCLVAGNRVTYSSGGGGGIRLDAGLVENCVVSNNTAVGNGGGFTKANTSAAICRNCLIAGNQAGGLGGGVYGSSSGLGLQNCTIVGNLATNGGGIYSASAVLYATNCIVVNNTALQAGGTNDISGLSTNFGYSCSPLLGPGTGNTSADPQFVKAGSGYGLSWTAGDYRLRAGAPCLDTGVVLSWMAGASDLDGAPRIQGAGPAMGAYETETAIKRSGAMLMIR